MSNVKTNPFIHLLVIDMQNDFMDQPGATLAVTGAVADSKRTADLIRRLGNKIDDITVTLDSHHQMHVAHAMMWIDSTGKHPGPFTLITTADVQAGVWKATNPAFQDWQAKYVADLEAGGRYTLCIWPYHCIIGTPGHALHNDTAEAVFEWEKTNFAMANVVTKGSNYKTEHYSAVKAEVIDPTDPTTNINMGLIQALQEADIILVAGQASSHCVASTMRDIVDNFGPDAVKKIHILVDCMSPVGGFEKLADDFLVDIAAKGATLVKSTEFLI